MTKERLNELKCQLDVYGGGLSTSKFDELIADLERLQAFADLACKLYPSLANDLQRLEEGV